MNTPYTKRAELQFRKLAHNVSQEIPMKDLSWNQCWELLAEHGDLEGSIEMTLHPSPITSFTIYKNNNPIDKIVWTNELVYDQVHGDFRWERIYKDILQLILDKKYIKKPRATRKDKGKKKAVRKTSCK